MIAVGLTLHAALMAANLGFVGNCADSSHTTFDQSSPAVNITSAPGAVSHATHYAGGANQSAAQDWVRRNCSRYLGPYFSGMKAYEITVSRVGCEAARERSPTGAVSAPTQVGDASPFRVSSNPASPVLVDASLIPTRQGLVSNVMDRRRAREESGAPTAFATDTYDVTGALSALRCRPLSETIDGEAETSLNRYGVYACHDGATLEIEQKIYGPSSLASLPIGGGRYPLGLGPLAVESHLRDEGGRHVSTAVVLDGSRSLSVRGIQDDVTPVSHPAISRVLW